MLSEKFEVNFRLSCGVEATPRWIGWPVASSDGQWQLQWNARWSS